MKQIEEKPVFNKSGTKQKILHILFTKRESRKFQSIHPSKWKSYSINGLFDPSAINTHSEAPLILQSLITLMAEAYHRFSTVVNEHENSPWFSDSITKMKEIEKMTQRYIKIKESYEIEMNDRRRIRKSVHGLSEN